MGGALGLSKTPWAILCSFSLASTQALLFLFFITIVQWDKILYYSFNKIKYGINWRNKERNRGRVRKKESSLYREVAWGYMASGLYQKYLRLNVRSKRTSDRSKSENERGPGHGVLDMLDCPRTYVEWTIKQAGHGTLNTGSLQAVASYTWYS